MRALPVLLVLAAAGVAPAFDCTLIAKRGGLDPNTDVFTNQFVDGVRINGANDVVFIATAGGRQRVYRYPSSGPGERLVAVDDASPAGRPYGRFTEVRTDNDRDVAFRAILQGGGEALFFRPNGGAVQLFVQTGQPSPGGGSFTGFPNVGALVDTGVGTARMAFSGLVSGGPAGVFMVDQTGTVSALALAGGTDPDGKTVCSFGGVSNHASAAWVGLTATGSCGGAPSGASVYSRPIGGPTVVAARTGDSAPGGGTFVEFVGAPEAQTIDGVDRVLFRARVAGAFSGAAVFLWADGGGVTRIVGPGDDEPVFQPHVPGTLRQLRQAHLGEDEGSEPFVMVRATVRGATERVGIFAAAPTGTQLLVDTSSVPAGFGPNARYRRFDDFGASYGDDRFALLARVRDTVRPVSKTAIIRCVSVEGP